MSNFVRKWVARSDQSVSLSVLTIEHTPRIRTLLLACHKSSNRSSSNTMSSLCDPGVGVFDAHSNKRQKVTNDKLASGGEINPEAPVNNPFGLEEEAELWFRQEQERSKTSYLMPGPQYTPYVTSNSKIPASQFQAAFSEFGKRFGNGQRTTTRDAPSVLLVASGVISEDWVAGDDIGRARFLLIPRLYYEGRSQSALFLTYMPGPEHGSVDGSFADDFGAWRRRYPVLLKYFVSGQSSGGYGHHQPDKRLFPKKKFRDRQGRDIDRGNKDQPYSRFLWEVEYENKDPAELRQRGKVYMRCKYTRLFLAAKFYAPDGNGEFEASIVLWGKTTPPATKLRLSRLLVLGQRIFRTSTKTNSLLLAMIDSSGSGPTNGAVHSLLATTTTQPQPNGCSRFLFKDLCTK
jgi:hypothetical protein